MKNNKIYSKPKNGFCGAQNTPSNKDKVKNIFSWLLIGILCLTMCGSLLGTIAFTKDCKAAFSDGPTFLYENCLMPTNCYNVNAYGFYVNDSTVQNNQTLIHGTYYNKTDNYSYANNPYPVYSKYPNEPLYTIGSQYTSLQNLISSDISIKTIADSVYADHIEINFDIFNYTGNVLSGDRLYAISDYNGIYSLNKAPFWIDYNRGSNNQLSSSLIRIRQTGYSYVYFNSYGNFTAFDSNGNEYVDTNKLYIDLCLRFYLSSNEFSSSISKIEKGSYTKSTAPIPFQDTIVTWSTGEKFISSSYMAYNYLKFYDINNNYLEIAFPAISDSPLLFYSNTIEYTSLNIDTNASYERGKVDGVSEYLGSNKMEQDARSLFLQKWLTDYKLSDSFYNDAYTNFYNDFIQKYKDTSAYQNDIDYAYEDGRITGLSQSNQFNFTTMLSAAINAPLSAFKDMINFELLGVNLLGLFTGLFTVAFVLFVIRKLT